MNRSIIRLLLGQVIKLEALLMLLPCLIAVIYRESVGWYYLGTVIFGLALGFLMTAKKPKNMIFYLKEGCVTTALCWIVLSLLGCLPLWLSGEIPNFTNALFETISGFTTTGATILSDVEALTHAGLFWRSFTHWIGGMGVLVFLLAIVPMSGGSNINLMRAESTGPSVGKLVPKMRATARMLYCIYFGLTALEIVFLLLGHMPFFDAINTALATAGTGGFGIKNDSLSGYSPYIQWVVTISMLLFGINFNAYYLIILHKFKRAFSMEEVKAYLAVVVVATFFIFINIIGTVGNVFEALTQSAFQVAAIITTTGFSTVDFDLWNSNAKAILCLLMFAGGCAGSTAGGIKMSRFIVVAKTLKKELNSYIHPKSVVRLQMDHKPIEHEVIRSVNVYFITFAAIFVVSLFAVSLGGYDLLSCFTAVLATLNNVGPGLAMVGPTQNFAFFATPIKYVLMFDMLAGRLELFPMLILFHPALWKQLFGHQSR